MFEHGSICIKRRVFQSGEVLTFEELYKFEDTLIASTLTPHDTERKSVARIESGINAVTTPYLEQTGTFFNANEPRFENL